MEGSDVPLGFVSLRQPQVWVADAPQGCPPCLGPASPQGSTAPAAVCVGRAVEDDSALT